jgi:hypothetical protein
MFQIVRIKFFFQGFGIWNFVFFFFRIVAGPDFEHVEPVWRETVGPPPSSLNPRNEFTIKIETEHLWIVFEKKVFEETICHICILCGASFTSSSTIYIFKRCGKNNKIFIQFS